MLNNLCRFKFLIILLFSVSCSFHTRYFSVSCIFHPKYYNLSKADKSVIIYKLKTKKYIKSIPLSSLNKNEKTNYIPLIFNMMHEEYNGIEDDVIWNLIENSQFIIGKANINNDKFDEIIIASTAFTVDLRIFNYKNELIYKWEVGGPPITQITFLDIDNDNIYELIIEQIIQGGGAGLSHRFVSVFKFNQSKLTLLWTAERFRGWFVGLSKDLGALSSRIEFIEGKNKKVETIIVKSMLIKLEYSNKYNKYPKDMYELYRKWYPEEIYKYDPISQKYKILIKEEEIDRFVIDALFDEKWLGGDNIVKALGELKSEKFKWVLMSLSKQCLGIRRDLAAKALKNYESNVLPFRKKNKKD